MKQPEFKEIKKQYQLNTCSITRIAGGYVDGAEGDLRTVWNRSFLSLDEEDMYKYMGVFKKALAGGRNTTELPMEKSRQQDFLRLRDSGLKDEEALQSFFRKILRCYKWPGDYVILAIHDVYDIPGQEESEDIYDYLLVCLCPVCLEKEELAWDPEQQIFTHMERDRILKGPAAAVLYPAFNDRQEDPEHAELYIKKQDEAAEAFAREFFGYELPQGEEAEKEIWAAVLEGTLGRDGTARQVGAIMAELQEYVENSMDKALLLGREEARKILKQYCTGEQMHRYGEAWKDIAGEETKLSAEKIIKRGDFVVGTEHATLRIRRERAEEISVKKINGRTCLVMDMEDEKEITADGIRICTDHTPEDRTAAGQQD